MSCSCNASYNDKVSCHFFLTGPRTSVLNKGTAPSGLVARSVGRYSGIAGVMGSNPVQA